MDNNQSESITIIGTGAMACLFGALFSSAGIHVQMLGSWVSAIETINKTGITFIDTSGKTTIAPAKASNNYKHFSKIKLALVLVKSWQTETVASRLKQILDDDGLCVTLQNGFRNAEILSDALGKQRVLRGFTTYGATLISPGKILFGGEGQVILEQTPRVSDFLKLLHKATIPYIIPEDFTAAFWEKIIVNATINPLTAIWRVTNGEITQMSIAKSIIPAIIEEILDVAEVMNVNISSSFDELIQAVFTIAKNTSSNQSSMLQDIERCSPTEIDFINGSIVDYGNQHYVITPINEAIVKIIKTLIKIKCT